MVTTSSKFEVDSLDDGELDDEDVEAKLPSLF